MICKSLVARTHTHIVSGIKFICVAVLRGLEKTQGNGSSTNELRKSVCILDCLDSCGVKVIILL